MISVLKHLVCCCYINKIWPDVVSCSSKNPERNAVTINVKQTNHSDQMYRNLVFLRHLSTTSAAFHHNMWQGVEQVTCVEWTGLHPQRPLGPRTPCCLWWFSRAQHPGSRWKRLADRRCSPHWTRHPSPPPGLRTLCPGQTCSAAENAELKTRLRLQINIWIGSRQVLFSASLLIHASFFCGQLFNFILGTIAAGNCKSALRVNMNTWSLGDKEDQYEQTSSNILCGPAADQCSRLLRSSSSPRRCRI